MSWWIYMALMIGGGALGCGLTLLGCCRVQKSMLAEFAATYEQAEEVAFLKGADSREAEVLDLKGAVKLYSHTCSIMRDSLQAAGWSEKDLADGFGDLGIPAVHLGEREGCVLVPAVFDMHKQCLGLVGYGLRLEADYDAGSWCLGVVDTRSGTGIGLLAWPKDWPERVNAGFLRERGFEVV